MSLEEQLIINELTLEITKLQITIQKRIGLDNALRLISDAKASKGDVSQENLKELISIYQEFMINYLKDNSINESVINNIASKYGDELLTDEGFNDYLIDCFNHLNSN